jgi:hypothetical protein
MPCAVFIFFITIKPQILNAFVFVLFVKVASCTLFIFLKQIIRLVWFCRLRIAHTNPWRFRIINFNSLFSSSLQLSFLFSSKFQNSGDFRLRLITVLVKALETSKGFQHLRVRIAARRAGIVKRAKLGLKCILK